MEKFLIITSREYLNKITNKTFILSTLFTPLILVGLIFIIGWFASVNNDQVNNVSVVDNSGYIFDKLESTESIRYVQLEDFDLEEAKLISKTKSDFEVEIETEVKSKKGYRNRNRSLKKNEIEIEIEVTSKNGYRNRNRS